MQRVADDDEGFGVGGLAFAAGDLADPCEQRAGVGRKLGRLRECQGRAEVDGDAGVEDETLRRGLEVVELLGDVVRVAAEDRSLARVAGEESAGAVVTKPRLAQYGLLDADLRLHWAAVGGLGPAEVLV